jgi:hypothetical protein
MPTPPGSEWLLLDVGDVMFELDRPGLGHVSDDPRRVWEDAILKRVTSLGYQRCAAHQQILSNLTRVAEQEREDGIQRVVIVSTHAVFHYDDCRIEGLDPQWLANLNPDMLITITDNVLDVRQRLRASGQTRWTTLSAGALLDWREDECFITRMLADCLGKRHFLVPAHRAAQVLYDLILQRRFVLLRRFEITTTL